jgi:hypothetical protein
MPLSLDRQQGATPGSSGVDATALVSELCLDVGYLLCLGQFDEIHTVTIQFAESS